MPEEVYELSIEIKTSSEIIKLTGLLSLLTLSQY